VTGANTDASGTGAGEEIHAGIREGAGASPISGEAVPTGEGAAMESGEGGPSMAPSGYFLENSQLTQVTTTQGNFLMSRLSGVRVRFAKMPKKNIECAFSAALFTEDFRSAVEELAARYASRKGVPGLGESSSELYLGTFLQNQQKFLSETGRDFRAFYLFRVCLQFIFRGSKL